MWCSVPALHPGKAIQRCTHTPASYCPTPQVWAEEVARDEIGHVRILREALGAGTRGRCGVRVSCAASWSDFQRFPGRSPALRPLPTMTNRTLACLVPCPWPDALPCPLMDIDKAFEKVSAVTAMAASLVRLGSADQQKTSLCLAAQVQAGHAGACLPGSEGGGVCVALCSSSTLPSTPRAWCGTRTRWVVAVAARSTHIRTCANGLAAPRIGPVHTACSMFCPVLLWQLAPIPTNHPALRRMTSTLCCPHSCWRR